MTTKGLTGRALGEAVIDHVLTYPETHNQRLVTNECGTAACIAGWTIILHEGSAAALAKRYFSEDPGQPHHYNRDAAELLGVDVGDFTDSVFIEYEPDKAISNFKHLLDETYCEPV